MRAEAAGYNDPVNVAGIYPGMIEKGIGARRDRSFGTLPNGYRFGCDLRLFGCGAAA